MVSRASRACQPFEIVEVLRVGLRGAGGIEDRDPGRAKSDQGQAHCHPVIVVGLERGRMEGAGNDGQAIFMLLNLGTDSS